MNQLRVLALTTLILLSASRLPGQAPENWDGQVVACNRGTITFSVADAYLYSKPFSGYQWQFKGWYNVDPGKCEEIGSEAHYHNGGLFSGKDSVTLLAFAFYDSTGTWGAVRLSDPGNVVFHPSNQQFCVQRGLVGYNRDSPEGDLPRACDGAQTGYEMIPASFEYRGPRFPNHDNDHKNNFFVTLGPNDRAIPLGKQTSIPSGTQGSSQTSSNAAPKPADYGAAMLKWVREDVNAYIAASATGFEAYKKGDVVVSPGVRSWVSREAPLGSEGCWVVEKDSAAIFSCVLSTSTDLNALRSYYAQLTEDVTASLPRDWSPNAAPPFGPEYPASKAYQSSSGARGEIWIARAPSGGGYELRYELVTAEAAARPPEKRTAPPGPPQRPRPAPIMVGKADVSHLAGLLMGDTREYVSYILGPPTSDYKQDSSAFGGYPYSRDDGLSIRVGYDRDNDVAAVKVYSKGSRGTDPLLDLLGKSEAVAVALLGPPGTRESLWSIDDTDLVWSFPLKGRPAEPRPNPQSTQTLTLHFRTGVGCEWISVRW